MESKNYNEGLNIVDEIVKARCEINKANNGIENADFRLSLLADKNDPMWNKIKQDNINTLEKATEQYEMLRKKLNTYKQLCMPEEWTSLLQVLGIALARTEPIEHVADSLYDAQDLQKALSETANIILKKHQELEEAKNNGDTDRVTVIRAELNYYENDMKSHHWGASRLEALNIKSTEEESKQY